MDGTLGDVLIDSEHFHELVDTLPVALYMTDAAGRITYFNKAAANLWGRSPRIGEDFWCGSWRLYWPDGTPMPHDQCPMAQTLKTGRPVLGASAIAERPDGARFLIRPYPTPIYDSAGHMTGAVNMLFDITVWNAPEQASQQLAAIVESSDDAIVSKDLDGTIRTWNRAAEVLFGYEASEIIGKSILTLIPSDRQEEETAIIGKIRSGDRIEHYETVRQRKDGSLVDVSLTVSPVRDRNGVIVGASKIARDISERKRNESLLERHNTQLASLYRVSKILSRDLNLERIVQAVTDVATELSGARFGAFFYNVVGENGEEYMLYSLSGASPEAFEKLGVPRNTGLFEATFRGTAIVRSDDIRKDPRYGKNPPHFGMPKGHLPVASYLAVPVISANGLVHGGLFFGHDKPGVFQEDTEGLIAAIASLAAFAIDNARMHRATEAEIEERRRTERANELLVNEIKHRVKNTLGTVQAMAVQTFRQAPLEERNTFVGRLHALAEAHDVLTQREWGSVSLSEMTKRAMHPFVDTKHQRISTRGADALLSPNRALLISMVLHELGTNAVKYGSLSNDCGTVDLDWEILDSASRRKLRLLWVEKDGPAVAPPQKKGFGSRMIEHAIRGEQGTSEFRFAPDGLVCTIEMPI
ncbi:MAG TPA: PAS domain S-box protein [Rhizomicrobium sp.]|nr:PAS domain S-box protein [Rhizomicrobium sp.]